MCPPHPLKTKVVAQSVDLGYFGDAAPKGIRVNFEQTFGVYQRDKVGLTTDFFSEALIKLIYPFQYTHNRHFSLRNDTGLQHIKDWFISIIWWQLQLVGFIYIFSLALLRFPEYNFISDNNISKSAGLTSRYSEESLHGIILDIHFLANADFLVCTFSSQVSASGFFISYYMC